MQIPEQISVHMYFILFIENGCSQMPHFAAKQRKFPPYSPPLPGRGEGGHTIDRCITLSVVLSWQHSMACKELACSCAHPASG